MLNLDRTRNLHDELAAMLPRQKAALHRALVVANRELAERRLTFGRIKPLSAALTALVLDAADVRRLRNMAEGIHAVIEKVLNFTMATPERLHRFFPEHRRIFPYLAKTRGCETWQVVSRYDAAVTPDGQLKLMELNTGCPGGFMIAEAMSDVTRHGFAELSAIDTTIQNWTDNGTIRPDALIDELSAVEVAAGIKADTIGLLNDENDLVFELDLIADAFRRQGRPVILSGAAMLRHAEELHGKEKCLVHDNQVLSLVYNKFRIST
ncbi:MAG: hypothetical protein JW829_12165, partial [Pirellulales bacterium]|nr:hypothetical protein [Pirellulales bacterium]